MHNDIINGILLNLWFIFIVLEIWEARKINEQINRSCIEISTKLSKSEVVKVLYNVVDYYKKEMASNMETIKKIKDLTIQDIKRICKKHGKCSPSCPLASHYWLCLGLENMTKKEMEEDIKL